MRADRLLAALMLLQRRGQVTTTELAAELEISPRTARRDLEALATSGVPIYSVAGRGGGWRLVGGARTDLTGLSEPEVSALFLALATQQSSSPAAAAALRKLHVAVPQALRPAAEQATRRVHHDPRTWTGRDVRESDVLARLQEALVRHRQVELVYRKADGESGRRSLSLIGLVDKASRWYAVAATSEGPRTFRVDRMSEVRLSEAASEVAGDLAVSEIWDTTALERAWAADGVTATARVEPWVAPVIGRLALLHLAAASSPGPDGWIEVTVRGATVRSLVGQLIGFGSALRLTGPAEVLAAAHDLVAELAAIYPRPDFGP